MAAAAGIFNHAAAAQSLIGPKAPPMDSSTSGSTSSAGDTTTDSATISANDFLTLLVTEMQNQDPTATTDPNEYINQLVQVNSLEQLIGINQTLTGAFGSTTDSTGDSSNQSVGAVAAITSPGSPSASTHTSSGAAVSAFGALSDLGPAPNAGSVFSTFAAHLAPGNLSVPAANPAAQRVAHALDGASPVLSGANR
ncbi:MAG TPA: flagellar hook capping FlgD N-terminal domain-containing protein [Terracidiphilus sp.]|nr:flagellar hook capping FlgD N-terminal domain-containing protein [Terracidiphilus sp.]